jgi:hypothetical protein
VTCSRWSGERRPCGRTLVAVATRAHIVQLHPETYGELEVEATRRHVEPDELANELVRERLGQVRAQRATPMQDALVALDAISARMPEVDAVRLVREGREQLGVRSA